jgi:hypothetical protein
MPPRLSFARRSTTRPVAAITLDGFEPTQAALWRMGMRNHFNYRWEHPVRIRSCAYLTTLWHSLYANDKTEPSRCSGEWGLRCGFRQPSSNGWNHWDVGTDLFAPRRAPMVCEERGFRQLVPGGNAPRGSPDEPDQLRPKRSFGSSTQQFGSAESPARTLMMTRYRTLTDCAFGSDGLSTGG